MKGQAQQRQPEAALKTEITAGTLPSIFDLHASVVSLPRRRTIIS